MKVKQNRQEFLPVFVYYLTSLFINFNGGEIKMKKIIISVLVSIFIMLAIPYIIVELAKPQNNATSTEPIAPTPTVSATQV